MSDLPASSDHLIPPRPVRRPWLKPVLWIAGLVLAGVLAIGVWKAYRLTMPRRLVERAETAAAARDLRTAFIHLGRALDIDPDNGLATRAIAQLLQDQSDPTAVAWWQRAVELDPNFPKNQVRLAECALLNKQLAVAEAALEAVPATEKSSADYFVTRAGLLFARGKRIDALSWYLKAQALEPANPAHRFNVANARLGLNSPVERHAAKLELQAIAEEKSHVRLLAMRSLRDNLLGEGNVPEALAWARRALQNESIALDDRTAYLTLLRRADPAAALTEIRKLQTEVSANPPAVSHVLHWLLAHGQAPLAVEWVSQLSPQVQSDGGVSLVVARCYLETGRWLDLEKWTTRQNVEWGRSEHLRLAMLARAQSQQAGKSVPPEGLWSRVLSAAKGRTSDLRMLADLARDWGWDEAENDALWRHAESNQAAARVSLPRLFQKFDTARDNRRVHTVVARMLESDPKNTVLRDVWVWTGLLIGASRPEFEVYTRENLNAKPTDNLFLLTRALLKLSTGAPTEAATFFGQTSVTAGSTLLERIRYAVVEARLRTEPTAQRLLSRDELQRISKEERAIIEAPPRRPPANP